MTVNKESKNLVNEIGFEDPEFLGSLEDQPKSMSYIGIALETTEESAPELQQELEQILKRCMEA